MIFLIRCVWKCCVIEMNKIRLKQPHFYPHLECIKEYIPTCCCDTCFAYSCSRLLFLLLKMYFFLSSRAIISLHCMAVWSGWLDIAIVPIVNTLCVCIFIISLHLMSQLNISLLIDLFCSSQICTHRIKSSDFFFSSLYEIMCNIFCVVLCFSHTFHAN